MALILLFFAFEETAFPRFLFGGTNPNTISADGKADTILVHVPKTSPEPVQRSHEDSEHGDWVPDIPKRTFMQLL